MVRFILQCLQAVSALLSKSLGRIFLIHLVYIALGILLFAPLFGVLTRLILYFAGRPMIADIDILFFLLSPLGMASLILFGALFIAISIFEQASMMILCAATAQEISCSAKQAIYYTWKRTKEIFSFSVRLILRILLITLPFLFVAAVIAWLLITKYDINYYLSLKPAEFLLAASLIAFTLLLMLVILARKLVAWSLTLPLIMFTDIAPAASFSKSEHLSLGNRNIAFLSFMTWAFAALILGALTLGALQLFGSRLIPYFSNSLNLMVIVLGGIAALGALGNILVSTIASGSFASLLVVLYGRFHTAPELHGLSRSHPRRRLRFTFSRLIVLLISGTIISAAVGVWLLQGIQARDNITIYAHRGAAGTAPENTLAAIRQAITDGTDWVEIDVQETVDGKIAVIHDSDLMKLAGVNLKVYESTLAQLKEVDVGSWFNPDFMAERIPTLKEVLEEARGESRVLIELKYYGHDQQLEKRVVDIVEQENMVDEIAIMSLKYDGIQKVRSLRPDWDIGLLSATAIGDMTGLEADFLAVNRGMATSAFVHSTKSANKDVLVWTINDPISMSQMISLGVDGIITDEPALAREVIAERSKLSTLERLLLHTAQLLGQPIPQTKYRDQSP
ncbi:MAG: glycerophosphodiester phosphodiesterase [Desulfobacterales bacterium]|nr:glycerophosphodiester phosphodiesterase [Desulfobacterales bacterium]